MSWNKAHGYPEAYIGARAWRFRCPECRWPDGCGQCDEGKNCTEHWSYLLANNGFLLLLQCRVKPEHVFELDSRSGNPARWWEDYRQANKPMARYLLLPRRLLGLMGLSPN